MTDIKSLTKEQLANEISHLGEPRYRAEQIYQWLSKGCRSFDEMSNIPQTMKEKLKEKYSITSPVIARKQVSQQDGTMKYLWELQDKNCIESVLMQYHHGNTICISTQVGCRMGCRFCASTIGGKSRDLLPSEMLDQIIFTELDSHCKISNIVLMGIGEPLDNFENVIQFLELVNAKDGRNIGMRHISLSTCGLADQIDKLASYALQLTLSISLHAPNDELRSRLMPVNRKYPLKRLMESCRKYQEKTGRRISFEYALIRGVNDSDQSADELVSLLKGLKVHVNLIQLNNVTESPLRPSNRVQQFQERLIEQGINTTVRRRLGSDIDASCGQLRRKYVQLTGDHHGSMG